MAEHSIPQPAAHDPPYRWFWPLLALLCLLAWLVYRPGLSGGFLFDDWVNLDALGAFGTVDNWAVFWRYITSGTADPTGRPLALLSFLLDSNHWPTAALPFKRDNVILHLTNGVLLALLLRQLGRATHADARNRRVDIAALLGAALWMLHPLLVSTTLYVVQREAMLPATFSLLGILGYIAGHKRILAGKPSGMWIAAGSIVLASSLGMASKANGVLLPLLILLVDWVLLRTPINDARALARLRWIRIVLLVIPSCLVVAYLAYRGIDGMLAPEGPLGRPWTVYERLLTQPRVVVEYLQLLVIPQPYSHGLFNDQFTASAGLFSPISTLWCALALAALVTAATGLRRRLPILSAALLFYFCGHLLESTVLPLELYFEHRNYLPALLLFWPLGWWLADAWDHRKAVRQLQLLRRVLSIALPMLFAVLAWMRADLWGNTVDQALLWAQINPTSPRAQAYAAQVMTRHGHPQEAIQRLEAIGRIAPFNIQIPANLVNAYCAAGRKPPPKAMAAFAEGLEHGIRGDALAFRWLNGKLDAIGRNPTRACISLADTKQLVRSWASNPRVQTTPVRSGQVQHIKGRIQLLEGSPELALSSFNHALAAIETPATALRQAAILADAGHPELGLEHLSTYADVVQRTPTPTISGMRWVHQYVLRHQQYWQTEITRLRSVLAEEVRREKVPKLNAKNVPDG